MVDGRNMRKLHAFEFPRPEVSRRVSPGRSRGKPAAGGPALLLDLVKGFLLQPPEVTIVPIGKLDGCEDNIQQPDRELRYQNIKIPTALKRCCFAVVVPMLHNMNLI